MALKIAIVGLSPSTRHLAPWTDPDWELWGLPWDTEKWAQYDRLFELHSMDELAKTYIDKPDYFERLHDCENLYMQEAYFPGAIRYPLEEVTRKVGDYFESSISLMIGLAIKECASEIAIYGVDATDGYGYQKANIEYMIGFARGLGIRVHIPKESPLCKFGGDHADTVQYGKRYGWLK